METPVSLQIFDYIDQPGWGQPIQSPVHLPYAKASGVLVEVEYAELRQLLSETQGVRTGPGSSAMLRKQLCTSRPQASQYSDTWFTDGTRSHSGLHREAMTEDRKRQHSGVLEQADTIWSPSPSSPLNRKGEDAGKREESHPTSSLGSSSLCCARLDSMSSPCL